MQKISSETVRADFNDLLAVVHYTRAAHELGLWASERLLIERFFTDRAAPLLEAGCGAGRVTLGLHALGYAHLTAFDFAEELVDQARSLAAERGAGAITFLHADATELPPHLPAHATPRPALRPASTSPAQPECNALRDTPSLPPPSAQCNALRYTPLGPPLAAECNAMRDTAPRPPPSSQCNALRDTPPGPPPPAECNALRDTPPSADASDLSALGSQLPALSSQLAPPFGGALFMFNGLMQIPGRAHRRRALAELHRVCAPGAPFLFTTHDRDSSPTERALWRLETIRWERGEQDPRLVEFGDRYFEEEGTGRTFMHLPDRAEILADLAATGWTHHFDALRRDLAQESAPVLAFSDECRFWLAHRAAPPALPS